MMKDVITSSSSANSDSKESYNDEFYKAMSSETLRSARIYLAYLWKYIQAESVLDVGCGRGIWLKVCHELGSRNLYGLDGSWNSQSMMIDESIEFTCTDLNQPFSLNNKVDLVMTLEVAEHLEPSSATQFVKCLTDAADVILFSAAYTHQGGTNHINERPHSYWANLFIKNGYVPFDLFRPVFWGNEDVGFWYRQNTFLYLKKPSSLYQKFIDAGFSELKQVQFMDCVHPRLYDLKCGLDLGFKLHLKELIPSLFRAVRRRIST